MCDASAELPHFATRAKRVEMPHAALHMHARAFDCAQIKNSDLSSWVRAMSIYAFYVCENKNKKMYVLALLTHMILKPG